MSDEGFLKRWSRRKRAEEPLAPETESADSPPSNLPPQAGEDFVSPPPLAGEGREGVRPQGAVAQPKPDEEAIDPATLPPLESLGPDSDYTVFLRKGVPEPLRIAALRKAWMSDPFIRDFRGPAEYAIDYTTAEFDLRPTDDVAKMLDRIFPPKAPEPDPAAPTPPATPEAKPEPKSAASSEPLRLPQKEAAAPAPPPTSISTSSEPAPVRRKHGGALPDEPMDES
jgi:hypothetical protein